MVIHKETGTRPCVVVAEDDATLAWLISVTLADEGYSPVIVHSGRAALKAVEELHPSAITLDLDLPDIDGRAVLRGLKDITPSSRPRVIVVSSDADRLTYEEQRGVAGALKKPFNLGDLVRAVRAVSERRVS